MQLECNSIKDSSKAGIKMVILICDQVRFNKTAPKKGRLEQLLKHISLPRSICSFSYLGLDSGCAYTQLAKTLWPLPLCISGTDPSFLLSIQMCRVWPIDYHHIPIHPQDEVLNQRFSWSWGLFCPSFHVKFITPENKVKLKTKVHPHQVSTNFLY